jgi:hypothetical protein
VREGFGRTTRSTEKAEAATLINDTVWINYRRNQTGATKGTINETDPSEVDFNHKPSMIMHTSCGSGSDTRPGSLLARREIMVFF